MTGIELSIQRKSLGYTQSELAVLIGTSRAAVNRWENGPKPVKFLVASFMLGLAPKEAIVSNGKTLRELAMEGLDGSEVQP